MVIVNYFNSINLYSQIKRLPWATNYNMSKPMKLAFKLMARMNKAILPKYHKRDLAKLKKWEKAVVGYKYWITINSLK